MTQRQTFLGLDFDTLDAPRAAAAIAARARSHSEFAYVATPNVDHMVRIERDAGLKTLYRDAWLNLCDSKVLQAMAKASGLALPAAPGADVVAEIFRHHLDPRDPIVIIGGSAATVRALRLQYGLRDVRWHNPPAGLKDKPQARAACAGFIRNNPAPFIFLAVGSPQQELIAHETLQRGGATGVAICCGASLQFLSGEVKRAPAVFRATGLEWLWRLGSEPLRLWRRYLIDGPRILAVWRRWNAATR
jgi:N-acetylglucosaminyldiphosphoundecaprenol N-acetyl-beta-D-mannosaminyltransferase